MTKIEVSRKKLIIKFYLPHCETQEDSHYHNKKRRKVSSSKPTCHETNIAKDSRTVSKACELKNKKGYYAVAIWVNVENPSKSCGADSRNSRTGFDQCKMKDKNEGVHSVECKKSEKKEKVMMDRCKKMQCWAILKRLMIGRDGWALKEPLANIESKLKKWKYSNVDEFAYDIRLEFSYALQYLPRSEVRIAAMRIRDTFEITWKTLKDKWMHHQKEFK